MLCGVVACKDNDKVGGCSDGCIAGSGGYKVVVGMWVFGLGWRGGGEKGEDLHAGFTQIKPLTFDTILTDMHTLIIYINVYSILIF